MPIWGSSKQMLFACGTYLNTFVVSFERDPPPNNDLRTKLLNHIFPGIAPNSSCVAEVAVLQGATSVVPQSCF